MKYLLPCKLLRSYLTVDKFSEGQFKLVDSSGSEITSPGVEGLLIYNGGTVCSSGFNIFSAHAICRLIGFIGSKSWRKGEFFSIQKAYRIILKDVVCSSVDWTWSSCSYRTEGHDCKHQEDVFLTCGSGR